MNKKNYFGVLVFLLAALIAPSLFASGYAEDFDNPVSFTFTNNSSAWVYVIVEHRKVANGTGVREYLEIPTGSSKRIMTASPEFKFTAANYGYDIIWTKHYATIEIYEDDAVPVTSNGKKFPRWNRGLDYLNKLPAEIAYIASTDSNDNVVPDPLSERQYVFTDDNIAQSGDVAKNYLIELNPVYYTHPMSDKDVPWGKSLSEIRTLMWEFGPDDFVRTSQTDSSLIYHYNYKIGTIDGTEFEGAESSIGYELWVGESAKFDFMDGILACYSLTFMCDNISYLDDKIDSAIDLYLDAFPSLKENKHNNYNYNSTNEYQILYTFATEDNFDIVVGVMVFNPDLDNKAVYNFIMGEE